jgi:hypothetical protein
MYVDSSNGETGDISYLSFTTFISGNTSSLRFSFHMLGDDVGTLDVLSQNTDTSTYTVSNLWTRTGHQDIVWNKDCIQLLPNTRQNIFFQATKGSGFNGDIAIDNIYVVEHECTGTISLFKMALCIAATLY